MKAPRTPAPGSSRPEAGLNREGSTEEAPIRAASEAQRRAADPSASIWVSASAGTGKTKVLVDRVLALLLGGTAPGRILCLTYTRAAAAEMASRVQARLGLWAVAEDAGLDQDIAALGLAPDPGLRARARLLFAQVLDCPGGLKIQTIHAFCESLLRRFPIEAGLQPHFQVMDEVTIRACLDEATNAVLLAAEREPEVAAAFAVLTETLDLDKYDERIKELVHARGRIHRLLAETTLAATRARLAGWLGADPSLSEEDLLRAACREESFDGPGLRRLAGLRARGGTQDITRAEAMAAWLAAPPGDRPALWQGYLRAYLTLKGEPISSPLSKSVLSLAEFGPEDEQCFQAELERVQAIEAARRAQRSWRGSAALLTIARVMLDGYEASKAATARLDYDDLILKTRALLSGSHAAEWVLYKLDGGLDHILVDEAQDTGPDQWDVVRHLAEEFFSGSGSRQDAGRTIFAVGDSKQSIYRFQNADPAAFAAMREHFRSRVETAGRRFEDIPLNVSFRSGDAVLRAVDAVFARSEAAAGVIEGERPLQHRASRLGAGGRVILWPLAVRGEKEVAQAWAPDPRGGGGASDPLARLSREVAAQIHGWIGREPLPARGRTIHPGDIMILVRRRKGLVDSLVREMKTLGVPVAGVDRMRLADHLAVMDLMALGRFLLLPDDDLTLACVLKTPLFGLDDEDLFALAHGRASSLWQALKDGADASEAARPGWVRARKVLAGLLSRVDYRGPFALFAGLLDAEDGRRRMLAGLGRDAEDPINEFLERALEFERLNGASMQGFLAWMEGGQAEIKRDLDQQSQEEVRIMTVHGAKGLQAPVVVLPDTTSSTTKLPSILWTGEEGRPPMPLWAPNVGDYAEPHLERHHAIKVAEAEEMNRLLYVAMTRAEDMLVVCGAQGGKTVSEASWYGKIRQGLQGLAEVQPFAPVSDAGPWLGDALVLEVPQTAPVPAVAQAPAALEPLDPPAWLTTPAPAEPSPSRPLAPSDPGMEPGVQGPLGSGGAQARRGILVHRLLQDLPSPAPSAREAALDRMLARPSLGLSEEERASLRLSVLAVLAHPDFAPLFGPGSLAEVPMTGVVGKVVLSGRIDRLAVLEGEILAVDYKTGRRIPESAEAVPIAYLRQMALYRAALAQVFPDRPVRCALLFTDGPKLIDLPAERLDAVLDSLSGTLSGPA